MSDHRPGFRDLVHYASLLLAWLVVVGSQPHAAAGDLGSDSTMGSVLSLSDLHFDPFYGYDRRNQTDPNREDVRDLFLQLVAADYSDWDRLLASSPLQADEYSRHRPRVRRGEHYDTNDKLLQSALDYAKCVCADPDFIVITGDFLAHTFTSSYDSFVAQAKKDLVAGRITDGSARATAQSLQGRGLDLRQYRDFVRKTISYASMSIARRYPSTRIYAALGNNDSYTGDYSLRIKGADFLQDMTEVWEKYFLHFATSEASQKKAFEQSFAHGGFYEAVLPKTPNHRILVLSTTLFSKYYSSRSGQAVADSQLGWLKTKLEAAESGGYHVWILGHISPGLDGYSLDLSWKKDCNTTFVNQVMDHPAPIQGVFMGHTHMDEFKLFRTASGDDVTFVHINPGITPWNGNNSGFQVLSYDRSNMTLKNFVTYCLNNDQANALDRSPYRSPTDCSKLLANKNAWRKEYSFRDSYGSTTSETSVLATMKRVYRDTERASTTRDTYSRHYFVDRGTNEPDWAGGYRKAMLIPHPR